MSQLSKGSEQGVRRWDAAAGQRRWAPSPGGPTERIVVGAAGDAPVGVLVEARTLVVLTPPDFAERLSTWPADAPALG